MHAEGGPFQIEFAVKMDQRTCAQKPAEHSDRYDIGRARLRHGSAVSLYESICARPVREEVRLIKMAHACRGSHSLLHH